MKPCIGFLGFLPVLVVGTAAVPADTTVTITSTRTFTTCPTTVITTCKNTHGPTLETSITTSTGTTTSRSIETSSTVTTLSSTTTLDTTSISTPVPTTTASTTSSPSSSTTTSIPASPTTTSITPGTISNPGQTFLPSGQISAGSGKLAKRSTVYIDMSNPNAGALTSDITKAVSFSIDSTGFLETTLRDYPNFCGSSPFPGTSSAPSRFYCDDSGAFPLAAKGWTDSPTFRYLDWTFCYTSDMSLYLSQDGPTGDCTAITFTADFSGSA